VRGDARTGPSRSRSRPRGGRRHSSFAASAAEGLSRGAAGGTTMRSAAGRVWGAADGSLPVLSGGVGGDDSFSAKGDVVLCDLVGDEGTAGGALGARRPAGVGDADDGSRGRNVGAGTGTAGLPARGCEPPKARARPPCLHGGPHGRPGWPQPEGTACDSRPGSTRHVRRDERGTVTPPRLQ